VENSTASVAPNPANTPPQGAQSPRSDSWRAAQPHAARNRLKWSRTGTLRTDLETHRCYPNGGRRQTQITVGLQVEDAGFRSVASVLTSLVLRAYVEGSDDPDAALEDQEVILPPLKVGDRNCTSLEAIGHETSPSPLH